MQKRCFITFRSIMHICDGHDQHRDSGLRTGLLNTKLHLEILHQDYIAQQSRYSNLPRAHTVILGTEVDHAKNFPPTPGHMASPVLSR